MAQKKYGIEAEFISDICKSPVAIF